MSKFAKIDESETDILVWREKVHVLLDKLREQGISCVDYLKNLADTNRGKFSIAIMGLFSVYGTLKNIHDCLGELIELC